MCSACCAWLGLRWASSAGAAACVLRRLGHTALSCWGVVPRHSLATAVDSVCAVRLCKGTARLAVGWAGLAHLTLGAVAGLGVVQELGLSDEDAGSKSAGRATASSTERPSSSSSSTTSSSKAQASSESKAVSSSSQGYREAPKQKASRAQDVEDELQALKRKLGMK